MAYNKTLRASDAQRKKRRDRSKSKSPDRPQRRTTFSIFPSFEKVRDVTRKVRSRRFWLKLTLRF